jgi:membrane fusion protein, multidrug efflux system
VITVGAADVSRTVELPGRAQAVRTAQVRARVEGIVEARLYAEGSDVAAGALLFRLDSRVLAATVDQAKAGAAKAQAEVENAKQALDRTQSLAAQKMASAQQLDQALARHKQALADLEVAKATLRRVEIDLSYATVTAPIAGRIGRALVTEGALVGKGEATHLATIEQLDPIWINFSQSSADFLRLREAMAAGKAKAARDRAVRLILEHGREYPLTGKLLFTDLAVDPANGTVGLRAEFPNPQKLLLPGQYVNLRLPVAEAEGVISVPQRAVQASPQGQVVMIVGAENRMTPRPVKTAGMAGTNWIISEGLSGGEQVIVNGLQKARPGSPVKPVPVGASQTATVAGAPPAGAGTTAMTGAAGTPGGSANSPNPGMSGMAGMVGMAGGMTSMSTSGAAAK